jgi:hypothetical protein
MLVKRPIPSPPAAFRKRLAHAFAALVQGFEDEWSEDVTWDTWKPFYVELDASTDLTPESFRVLIKSPPDRNVRFEDFNEYFDDLDDPTAGVSDDERQSFDLLRKLMLESLTETTTVLIGENQLLNLKVFLVGRLNDGSVVGIRAVAVET